jgi:hypothetical protein
MLYPRLYLRMRRRTSKHSSEPSRLMNRLTPFVHSMLCNSAELHGHHAAAEDSAERKHELARGRPDDQIPLRRAGTPAEVADVVVALA